MKKLLILLLLTIILCPVASAYSGNVVEEQADAIGTDKLEKTLPDSAGKLMGGLSVLESLDVDKGVGSIFSRAAAHVKEILGAGIKSAVLIVLISLACSFTGAVAGTERTNFTVMTGTLAVSAVSVTSVAGFIGLGASTLDELSTFSKMLLPTLTTAAVSSGAITSAAAKYAATAMFSDILITISKGLILPLIFAYVAASVAEAAIGGDALSGAAGLMKWLAKTLLSITVSAFAAYLLLTGVITGASDAVAVRAAKMTLSAVLPVVGGIIAKASETILAGAAILKNAIGIFGLLAVSSICLIPFLRLGVNYLLYKLAGSIVSSIADAKITRLINAMSTAFGMILGMVGVSALMLFISIISVIRVAV